MSVGYRYDELNRLEHVDDLSSGLPVRTTSYTYNTNGSLETVTSPNGIQHAYAYDTLNRLRSLVVGPSSLVLPFHTYDHKLRASGHRRQVLETLSSQPSTLSSPRTITYTYDELYRLTGENRAGDPNGNNGNVSYDLDKVGNRQNRLSSVSSVPSVLNQTFNSRDWLNSDSYDPNGNTIVGQLADLAARGSDVYDFENRLILRTKADGTSINISYDADGNRIAKNILDSAAQPVSSTTWLVDTNNLTGYAQAFEERVETSSGTTIRGYTYGSALISQATKLTASSLPLIAYYAFDGHGSVRELTDTNGAVTDRYDYDAFGNLTFSSGTTANAYRYAGEQYDPDLGLYYNRARYLNTDSGRFWSMDSYEGKSNDPMSLHKYLYAHADPVGRTDPSGHFSIGSQTATVVAIKVLSYLAIATFGVLTANAVRVGPAVQTQTRFKQLQAECGNFECHEFADKAKEFLEKNGARDGEDFTIVEYQSKTGMTYKDWIHAVPGFGRFGGQMISSNGNHRGVLLSNDRRRWAFLTGTVSDNNVLAAPFSAWLFGYEMLGWGGDGWREMTLEEAQMRGVGTIRFLKMNPNANLGLQ